MRLSWNEIRDRVSDFARECADATYEKGETNSFYNELFENFGTPDTVPVDLFADE